MIPERDPKTQNWTNHYKNISLTPYRLIAAGDINWKNIEQTKCYITYNYNSRKVEISHRILSVCTRALSFNIYFTSYEAAKKAIEFIGEEKIKRYYFDIDEKK